MLIIRKKQLEKLSEYELDQYKVRLKMHLKEFFPLQTSLASDDVVNSFIELGLEQAQSFGFETEVTAQSFIDHTLLLGSDFCQNPLFTKISSSLFDTEIENLIQRHDILYDRAWQYLDETRGPDAAHLLRAAAKLKKSLTELIKTAANDLHGHVEALKIVYPEKYVAHSEETIKLFCIEGLRRAQSDNFEQASAQRLYVIIAFLTGIGFYEDPLVIGIVPEQVKALLEETDPSNRTRLLTDAAGIYLDSLFEAVHLTTTTNR